MRLNLQPSQLGLMGFMSGLEQTPNQMNHRKHVCRLPYAKDPPDGGGMEDDYAGGGSEDDGGGNRRASVRNRGKPNMKVGGEHCGNLFGLVAFMATVMSMKTVRLLLEI